MRTFRSSRSSRNNSLAKAIGKKESAAPKLPSIPSTGDLKIDKQDSVRAGEIDFDPELEAQLTERIQSMHDENLMLDGLNNKSKTKTKTKNKNKNNEQKSSQSSGNNSPRKIKKIQHPSLLRVYGNKPLQFLCDKLGIFIHRVKIGPLYKEMDPYAVWEVDVITFNSELMDDDIKFNREHMVDGSNNSPSKRWTSKSTVRNQNSLGYSRANDASSGHSVRSTLSKQGSKGNLLTRGDSEHVNVQPYCSVYSKYLLGATDVAGQSEAIVTNEKCTTVFEGDFALRIYHVNNDHRRFRGQIWLHSHFVKYDKGSKKHSITFDKLQIDKMCEDHPKHEKVTFHVWLY